MDTRMPSGNDNFANNSNVYGDSQQFNAYDNLNMYQNGTESSFNDPSWSVNPGDYSNQSRGQQATPTWQQNASHLSTQSTHAAFNGQGTPYGRASNQSPVGFNPTAFNSNLGGQQNFAYRQPQYDPSLVTQQPNGQNFNIGIHNYNSAAPNGATITPQALEREAQQSTFPNNPYKGNGYPSNFGQAPSAQQFPAPQRGRSIDPRVLLSSIPQGADSGMFSIINFDTLAQATSSERMSSFANVGKEAVEFDCSRMALPQYVARRSRNEIRAAAFASGNHAVLAKIGRKSHNAKTSAMHNAKVSAGSPSAQQLKYEEQSSSTEDSSDDSAYSDDEDDSDSPLPPKRPDDPKGGVEYDTIKALWRSKRRSLAAETIRQSLVDFWELVKTIRDRWKADAQAVTDAEAKKRMGELPLLQSRVKDQRDMIEAAFRAALKHGHRAIVEIFAENVALLYLCYQFLLDRVKAEDYNGGLASAILETMSLFTTMGKDKLEKTHLIKVLPRFQKKGNAKTQYWIKKINSNAEAAPKAAPENAATKPAEVGPSTSVEQKTVSPAKKPAPEPVAGVKRAASTASGGGAAQKKLATGTTKPGISTASKVNGVVKKQVSATDANKTPTTTAPVSAIRKTVVAKPSGFFSSLTSASKKPGASLSDRATTTTTTKPAIARSVGTSAPASKPTFSFAETMANLTKPKEEKTVPIKPQKELPPETDEQRTKRLRKEERKKLHVRFKPADELVEIRLFTHDPEEEIDHDSSQMRDVSDVGGEGRMLKQQSHMMDIDEEDDDDLEQEDIAAHPALSLVDFNVVDIEERKRMYAPYGGGQLEVESAERSLREEYERQNLIVFYPERSQVPPNPREPVVAYSGDQTGPLKYFAQPDEKYAARARMKRAQRPQQYIGYSQPNQQSAIASNPDIQSILASLRQTTPAQAPQAQAPFMAAPTAPTFQTAPAAAPVVPPANIDLAAILASLNAGAAQQGGYPATAPSVPAFGQGVPRQDNASNDPEIAKMRATNPNYKTRVCRFWQDGRCQKGDACSYLHE